MIESEKFESLEQKCQKYIDKYSLFTKEDKILCGVSGGVDSMVMVVVLKQLGYEVAIAHCNFNLRGEESDSDQTLVERWAISNGVKMFTASFETTLYAAENGVSIQMAARDLRYNWFSHLLKSENYTKIAIAHNSGDDVEGFFINLIRGTGVRGLSGMKNSNQSVVRPLMGCSRPEIQHYSEQNGVEYHTDSSNLKTKYLRNKIRIDLLKSFREIEPLFDQIMGKNLSKIEESVSLLDYFIEKEKSRLMSSDSGVVSIDLEQLNSVPNSSYLLYEMVSPMGFSRENCNAIVKSFDKSGLRFEMAKYRAIIDRYTLKIEPKNVQKESFEPIVIGSEAELNEFIEIERLPIEQSGYKSNKDSFVAFVSEKNLSYPLTFRLWQQSDRFSPLGMVGEKKISDFLIDNKLSLFEKSRQLVALDSSGAIFWLVARRISNKFRVENSEKEVVKISLKLDENGAPKLFNLL